MRILTAPNRDELPPNEFDKWFLDEDGKTIWKPCVLSGRLARMTVGVSQTYAIGIIADHNETVDRLRQAARLSG